MSSHHIIRDGQEPPVFIFAINNNLEMLQQLLEWSPIVIVDDKLLPLFDTLQIKVDHVLVLNKIVGNKTSYTSTESIYSADGLLATIENWVAGKNITGVNVFVNDEQARKLVQQLQNVSISLPYSLYVEGGRILVSGKNRFKKWYTKGQKLKVLSGMLSKAQNLINEGDFMTVATDGFVIAESENGSLILMEI